MAKLKLRNMQQLLIYESYPICHLNSFNVYFLLPSSKNFGLINNQILHGVFYILIRHRLKLHVLRINSGNELSFGGKSGRFSNRMETEGYLVAYIVTYMMQTKQ